MEIDVKNYINENISLNGRLFPVFTDDISALSIVYTFTPVLGGTVKQSQLTLKVIWSDYDDCKAIEKELNATLDHADSDPFVAYNNTKFKSALSGGGILFNDGPQMYELTLIYIIKWREK
jgi:hypothetical protein